jgi:putative oxidoreductase
MTISSTRFMSRGAALINADVALLILRVCFGVTLAVLHGWGKTATLLSGDAAGFPSVLGIPPTLSCLLAVLAEIVAALLVAIGMLTRAAAAYLCIFFVIAVVVMHGGALTGEQGGEMAFLNLAAFAAIALAGPGGYSVDAMPRVR